MEAKLSGGEEEEDNRRRSSSSSCKGEPVGVEPRQIADESEKNDRGNRLLGTRLPSQLESSEEDAIATKLPACTTPGSSIDVKDDPETGNRECETQKMGIDDIVRELRKLRRQNTITHCLLSGLIMVTVAWQFSEVSLLLYMRNKIRNPFKGIQSIISGVLSRRGDLQDSTTPVKIEESPLAPIGVPELPHMEWPNFTLKAHVRGHQVRKAYKVFLWTVGVLEKIILRWRRRGVGLRGFRAESEPIDATEDDALKVFRKQKVDRALDQAVSRVLSMVESPEARKQYRRMLESYRLAKLQTEIGNASEATSSFQGIDENINDDMDALSLEEIWAQVESPTIGFKRL